MVFEEEDRAKAIPRCGEREMELGGRKASEVVELN